eukprot:COSAG05_NODE_201_length_14387_cov_59.959476_2_plen_222_part_00
MILQWRNRPEEEGRVFSSLLSPCLALLLCLYLAHATVGLTFVLGFSHIVEHKLQCCNRDCNVSSCRRELYHDLSLDLPPPPPPAPADDNASDDQKKQQQRSPPQLLDLQNLLERYFFDEEIEKRCEKCGCENAVVSKRIVTLPRVLILHLKRFNVTLVQNNTAATEREGISDESSSSSSSGGVSLVYRKRADHINLVEHLRCENLLASAAGERFDWITIVP